MAFGPDFFEEAPAQNDKPVKQNRPSNNRDARNAKSGTGVVVALILGLILGVGGMTFGSLLAPDADGIVKLVAFILGVIGFIMVVVSFKKFKR